MGYCTRCGDAVEKERCACGGRPRDSVSKPLFGESLTKDKWSSRYLSKSPNASPTTRTNPIDFEHATKLGRNKSLKSNPLESMVAQYNSTQDDNTELQVFGNLLDPKDHWECKECKIKFKSEATIYPHPDAKTDQSLAETFFCRACFGKNYSKGTCKRCKAAVLTDAVFIRYNDLLWHDTCFICSYCSVPSIPSEILMDITGVPSCAPCFDSSAYLENSIPPSPHLSRTHSNSKPVQLRPVRSKYGGAPAIPDYVPGVGSRIIVKKESGSAVGLGIATTNTGGGGRGWNTKDEREKSPMVKSFDELGDKMRNVGLKKTLAVEKKVENKTTSKTASTVRAPVDYGRSSTTQAKPSPILFSEPPSRTGGNKVETKFIDSRMNTTPRLTQKKESTTRANDLIPTSASSLPPPNQVVRPRTWSAKSIETRPASPAPIKLPGGSNSPVKDSPFRSGHQKSFSIPSIGTILPTEPIRESSRKVFGVIEKEKVAEKVIGLGMGKNGFIKPISNSTPTRIITLPTLITTPATITPIRNVHGRSQSVQVGLSVAERRQIFGFPSPISSNPTPFNTPLSHATSKEKRESIRPHSAQATSPPMWRDKLRPTSPLKKDTGAALTPRVPFVLSNSGRTFGKKEGAKEEILLEKNLLSVKISEPVGINPRISSVRSTFEIKPVALTATNEKEKTKEILLNSNSTLEVEGAELETDICGKCKKDLGYGELIELTKTKEAFHRECFNCVGCEKRLEVGSLYAGEGGYYHAACQPKPSITRYLIPKSPKLTTTAPPVRAKQPEKLHCQACGKDFKTTLAGDGIDDLIVTTKSGTNFHKDCFGCAGCGKGFEKREFFEVNGLAFHEECKPKLPILSPFSTSSPTLRKPLPTLPKSKRVPVPAVESVADSTCSACKLEIFNEFAKVNLEGKGFHRGCLICWICKKKAVRGGEGMKLVCEEHWSEGKIEGTKPLFSR